MIGIEDSTTDRFGSLIRSGGKFIIPKFQRDYSWDAEQWEDLWQDIENMRSEKTGHYMGYLVLQSVQDTKDVRIIDGQQRFTTITLIVLAAIKSIQKLMEAGIEVEENTSRIDMLKTTYIGKKDSVSLEYENILRLNRNNNAYYKDYIVKLGDLKIRNLSYTEKLMKRCFEWYEDKLTGKYTSGKEYAQFIEDLMDNLYFTIIKVTDEMNAFRVFETLNARGVQLSSSDLLKNYLFSLVDNTSEHPERIHTLEDKWEALTKNIKEDKLPEFIRYYWNSKNKTVRANELFKTIRNSIKTDRAVFETINEMIEYSDIYMALKDGDDDLWQGNRVIREHVILLNLFNLKQPISLLMSAYKNLAPDQFINVLKDTIVVSFRYNVIGAKNPNEIERVYNEMATQIHTSHLYPRDLLRRVYIEDREFEISFSTAEFKENTRNNKIARYILGKLDRFSGHPCDIELDNETITVEHIYSQHTEAGLRDDEMEYMIYRLGNMCLLEKNLNRTIGNASYDDKAKVYTKSSLVATQNLPVDYPTWTKGCISQRQLKMARCAKSIWKIDF